MAGARRGGASSTAPPVLLQLLLFLSGTCSALYLLATLMMISFKKSGFHLSSRPPGPRPHPAVPAGGSGSHPPVLGAKGNMVEIKGPLAASLVLTVASGLLCVYFLLWQTLVLRVDSVLSAVILVLHGMEAVLQVVAGTSFPG